MTDEESPDFEERLRKILEKWQENNYEPGQKIFVLDSHGSYSYIVEKTIGDDKCPE